MSPRMVVMEMTKLEATHLAGLVEQFAALLEATPTDSVEDPAIARLVPDAYEDDPQAAREFRDLTQRELLDRRATDAATVLATLRDAGAIPADGPAVPPSEQSLTETAAVPLSPEELGAWLRTLAAVRLILASRLGIRSEEDHDDDDPRFGVYDWLGFRLEGLVRAAEDGDA